MGGLDINKHTHERTNTSIHKEQNVIGYKSSEEETGEWRGKGRWNRNQKNILHTKSKEEQIGIKRKMNKD